MKKTLCLLLVLLTFLSGCVSLAEGVKWSFAVPLTDVVSDYSILVNKDHPLERSFVPAPLIKVTGVKRATSATVQMQETAARALIEFFEAAKAVDEYTYVANEKGQSKTQKFSGGMTLFLKSGYRSFDTQASTYATHLQSTGGRDDGFVMPAGSSEHQTGLCADILNPEYKKRPKMTQDFKWTPEAQWMKENCASFGFILRYPEENEKETGISFEPWHFRYVGVNIANYIMSRGITLEAFNADAKAAYDLFIAAGGDVDAQLEYELTHSGALPDSFVLDEYGEDGDPEISLDI